jgi:hypothetical protein
MSASDNDGLYSNVELGDFLPSNWGQCTLYWARSGTILVEID